MRVLLFDVQSGSLAGNLYLGERGRSVPGRGGDKEGQGIPGEDLGVTVTLALSRNSSPPSQGLTPVPKEVALVYSEDSVTVSPFPEI